MNSRFSLRWDNYTTQLTDAFGSLLLEEDLVDVTLSCEGRKIKAHKMLLSACSPYFHDIFKENPCQHPVIVFRNVQYVDLKAIVDFIYCGEVNVLQEQLESFLSTASDLEIKGLTDQENESEAEKMSGVTMVETVSEQRTTAAKKQVSRPSTTSSGRSSPVAKKRKTSVEKLSEEPLEEVTVKKEVEEDLVAREDDVEVQVDADAEITDPLEVPNVSLQEDDVEPSKDEPSVILEEPPTTEEEIECIDLDASVEEESHSETIPPEIKPVETKPDVPLKKRKSIPEKDKAEAEIPLKSGKKPKQVPAKTPPKTTVKGKIQIPKGLVVTSVKTTPQVENLFDFPSQEPQIQDEANSALRSEEASTPVHSEPMTYPQEALETMVYEDVPQQNTEAEPEIAAEAPVLEQNEPEEPEPEPEEEKKFDYFGCEICQKEAKPVDLERMTYNHKCPICPCCCFCAHLLKEHMRVIHGWFNVQRRFTHYQE